MSDQTFNLSALTTILEQARTDSTRLRKEVERAETKATAAENRVKTLEDTIAQLSAGVHGKTQKEMILDIINAHDGKGITARDIIVELEKVGFTFASKNPTASIHVAAEQLKKEEKIEVVTEGESKLFKRKCAQQ